MRQRETITPTMEARRMGRRPNFSINLIGAIVPIAWMAEEESLAG